MGGACAVGLARYAESIPQLFDFRPTENVNRTVPKSRRIASPEMKRKSDSDFTIC
jgi:hypothetical protein